MKYSWTKFLNEDRESEVGIVACLNDEQQFLILRRSPMDARSGQWTMPGGHVDPEDDSIEAGTIRELDEEAGITESAKRDHELKEALKSVQISVLLDNTLPETFTVIEGLDGAFGAGSPPRGVIWMCSLPDGLSPTIIACGPLVTKSPPFANEGIF